LLSAIGAVYGSIRNVSQIYSPAILLHLGFLFLFPIVVTEMRGERLLRTILIGTWATYVAWLCVGLYRFHFGPE